MISGDIASASSANLFSCPDAPIFAILATPTAGASATCAAIIRSPTNTRPDVLGSKGIKSSPVNPVSRSNVLPSIMPSCTALVNAAIEPSMPSPVARRPALSPRKAVIEGFTIRPSTPAATTFTKGYK